MKLMPKGRISRLPCCGKTLYYLPDYEFPASLPDIPFPTASPRNRKRFHKTVEDTQICAMRRRITHGAKP